jgi:multimeric flavodoxin WrbA
VTIKRPIVILGSSRRNGETQRAVNLALGNDADCISLQDYTFSAFDYQHANKADDFLKIVDLIMGRSTLIFATPVYWYAMSAAMKTFFDRLSDLITIEKQKGRSLAGKSAWLIATGTDEALPEGFEIPFTRTCAYFGIVYRGGCYLYTRDDRYLRSKTERQLREFGTKILAEYAST